MDWASEVKAGGGLEGGERRLEKNSVSDEEMGGCLDRTVR